MRNRSASSAPKATVIVVALAACLLASGCGAPSDDASAGRSAAGIVQEPGILYVLDPQNLGMSSQILAVDTVAGEIRRTYDAGRDPAMAVSPDGTRLYVASRDGSGDTLRVVDAATGEVLQEVALRNRWMSSLPAYFPTMELSSDGRWLYILEALVTGGDATEDSVAVFDTRTGKLLPRSASVPSCGGAALVPADRGVGFSAACHLSHDARRVTVSPEGAAEASSRTELPRHEDGRKDRHGTSFDLWRVAWAVRGPEDGRMYAVTQNGRVSVVDGAARRVTRTEDLGLSEDAFVPFGAGEISPAGDRLFLGIGTVEDALDRLTSDRVLVADTGTWETVAEIETSLPFQSLTVSPSGRYVYGISTEARSIVIVDVHLGEEVGVIEGVGESPTLGSMPATPAA
ncbi:MAG TPA: amine dehydrogenase large subunit [Actinomycetota bacterium]|nr:amine dehydrogenase large subunit [Actinomycetota bacterium]